MIKITKGQVNEVVVTVTEKTTLETPYYLFEFLCDDNQRKFYCIAADSSPNIVRYNLFEITETATDPDFTDGEITLDIPGFYHYTIYEQVSSTNLNPANATGIVEIGKLLVIGTTPEVEEYQTTVTGEVYNG